MDKMAMTSMAKSWRMNKNRPKYIAMTTRFQSQIGNGIGLVRKSLTILLLGVFGRGSVSLNLKLEGIILYPF